MSSLVPFGKYKGQPVEVLAADEQYCQWLAGQDWFRTRFANLYTVIINNGKVPEETPDHNALQARFLDQNFCFAVLAAWRPTLQTDAKKLLGHFRHETLLALNLDHYQKELDWAQMHYETHPNDTWATSHLKARERELANRRALLVAVDQWLQGQEIRIFLRSVTFEVRGADVEIGWFYRATNATFVPPELPDFQVPVNCPTRIHEWHTDLRIECKPSVGDEFPVVLRQMGANECELLVIGDGGYTGTGATYEQMCAMFATKAIKVVMASALAAHPDADRKPS